MMEDWGLSIPSEETDKTIQQLQKELDMMRMANEMASVREAVDAMLQKAKSTETKERINYNIEKALSMDADITYKDTEDGKTIIYVTKDGKTIENTFDHIDAEVKAGIDKAMALRKKKWSKNEAKASVKTRYKIGDHVILRGKIKDGSERIVKKFEVKKVIWSVHSNPVNILILKQIEGPNNNRSLDKNDCKKYHIKYEEGLQVYSMMLNFSKIRKK